LRMCFSLPACGFFGPVVAVVYGRMRPRTWYRRQYLLLGRDLVLPPGGRGVGGGPVRRGPAITAGCLGSHALGAGNAARGPTRPAPARERVQIARGEVPVRATWGAAWPLWPGPNPFRTSSINPYEGMRR